MKTAEARLLAAWPKEILVSGTDDLIAIREGIDARLKTISHP